MSLFFVDRWRNALATYIAADSRARTTAFTLSAPLTKGLNVLLIDHCYTYDSGSQVELSMIDLATASFNVTSVSGGATFEEVGSVVKITCPADGTYTIRGATGTSAASNLRQRTRAYKIN